MSLYVPRVGLLVECITDDWPFRRYAPDTIWPGYRHVYTIRAIHTQAETGRVGLHFEEIVNAPVRTPAGFAEIAFSTCAFRPLSQERLARFRQFLATASASRSTARQS